MTLVRQHVVIILTTNVEEVVGRCQCMPLVSVDGVFDYNPTKILRNFSKYSILTLELSSYVLEIPKDTYITLNQNLISCLTLSQEYCKVIG